MRIGRVPGFAVILLCLAWSAGAVNSRVYPLQTIAQGSGRIECGTAGAPDKGALRLKTVALKGAASGAEILDAKGQAGADLLKRVAPKQAFVLFISEARGGTLVGFTEGTWFRANRSGSTWRVESLRPEMARTFTGSSSALVSLVTKALAGKGVYPAPNPKASPSLGPVRHS